MKRPHEPLEGAVSAAKAERLRAKREYGSWENYQAKRKLIADTRRDLEPHRAALEALGTVHKGRRLITEEEVEGLLGAALPYWMAPFILKDTPLALIGAPDGSDEWAEMARKDALQGRRKDKRPFAQDYSDMGWPASCGASLRRVTPEEDAEIRRRLRTAGLTLPGSEVQNVGRTLADMMTDDTPGPEWIIEGLLRRGGACMVYGPSGIGKTWFVGTLMVMAAAGCGVGVAGPDGKPVWQAGQHRGARVCLIDGEMTEADLTLRATVITKALGLVPVGGAQFVPPMDPKQLEASLLRAGEAPEDAAGIASAHAAAEARATEARRGQPCGPPVPEGATVNLGNIMVFAKAAQDHRATFVDLADRPWLHRIVEYAKAEAIDVVVLDNLTTLSPSLDDENSATSISPLNDLIIALKKVGIATVVVHHTNKQGLSYRGSTAIAATLETIIALHKVEGPDAQDGAGFQVKVEKDRAGAQPAIHNKTLKLRADGWRIDDDVFGRAEEFAAKVKSLRYVNQEELAKALGLSGQPAVSRTLTVAIELGCITRIDYTECMRRARKIRDDPEPQDLSDLEFPEGPDI